MERRQERRHHRRPVFRGEPFRGPRLETGRPLRLLAQEPREGRFLDVHERRLPPAGVRLHLLGQGCELGFPGAHLGQAAGAHGAEGVADPVEEPDLRLPGAARPPRLGQERVRERVRVHLPGGGLGGHDPLQVHVTRPQRYVRRIVRDHDVAMGLRCRGQPPQRIDEVEGVAHPVPVSPLGVASVGLAPSGRGEEPAHVAPGLGSAIGVHGLGERPRVTLAHDHDDAHASGQAGQQRLEVGHAQLLVPEADGAVLCVIRIACSVVGHEDHELIARRHARTGRFEPGLKEVPPGRVQLYPGPAGVGQLRLGPKPVAEFRSLDEPEVRWRALPAREVRRGLLPIGGKDVDALGRHAPPPQDVDHVLQVVKVAQVVRLRLVAAVDQQDVKLASGRLGGADRSREGRLRRPRRKGSQISQKKEPGLP